MIEQDPVSVLSSSPSSAMSLPSLSSSHQRQQQLLRFYSNMSAKPPPIPAPNRHDSASSKWLPDHDSHSAFERKDADAMEQVRPWHPSMKDSQTLSFLSSPSTTSEGRQPLSASDSPCGRPMPLQKEVLAMYSQVVQERRESMAASMPVPLFVQRSNVSRSKSPSLFVSEHADPVRCQSASVVPSSASGTRRTPLVNSNNNSGNRRQVGSAACSKLIGDRMRFAKSRPWTTGGQCDEMSPSCATCSMAPHAEQAGNRRSVSPPPLPGARSGTVATTTTTSTDSASDSKTMAVGFSSYFPTTRQSTAEGAPRGFGVRTTTASDGLTISTPLLKAGRREFESPSPRGKAASAGKKATERQNVSAIPSADSSSRTADVPPVVTIAAEIRLNDSKNNRKRTPLRMSTSQSPQRQERKMKQSMASRMIREATSEPASASTSPAHGHRLSYTPHHENRTIDRLMRNTTSSQMHLINRKKPVAKANVIVYPLVELSNRGISASAMRNRRPSALLRVDPLERQHHYPQERMLLMGEAVAGRGDSDPASDYGYITGFDALDHLQRQLCSLPQSSQVLGRMLEGDTLEYVGSPQSSAPVTDPGRRKPATTVSGYTKQGQPTLSAETRRPLSQLHDHLPPANSGTASTSKRLPVVRYPYKIGGAMRTVNLQSTQLFANQLRLSEELPSAETDNALAVFTVDRRESIPFSSTSDVGGTLGQEEGEVANSAASHAVARQHLPTTPSRANNLAAQSVPILPDVEAAALFDKRTTTSGPQLSLRERMARLSPNRDLEIKLEDQQDAESLSSSHASMSGRRRTDLRPISASSISSPVHQSILSSRPLSGWGSRSRLSSAAFRRTSNGAFIDIQNSPLAEEQNQQIDQLQVDMPVTAAAIGSLHGRNRDTEKQQPTPAAIFPMLQLDDSTDSGSEGGVSDHVSAQSARSVASSLDAWM